MQVATPKRIRDNKSCGRSRVSNGRSLLPKEVDGRSIYARRYRDLVALHTNDLGGAANISAGEQALVRRACVIVINIERLELKFAQAEDVAVEDLDLHQRMSNTLKRLLESLGLKRRAKDVTPSLHDYLKRRTIDHDDDPASAQAEYFAKFRADIEAFITREAIEACVSTGVFERGRTQGIRYSAFCDPSGGSADSMTLAIVHKEKGIAVLDALRERKPPFSPDAVVADFAQLLKSYGINKVLGDRYAGEWIKEPFKKLGIAYDAAAKPKSDLYRDCSPLINSKKVDLLDHPKLVQQLIGLERRTARSGRDSIDHSPGQHDDVCNAACGALVNVGVKKYAYDGSLSWVGNETEETNAAWRRSLRVGHMLQGGGFRRLF